MKDILSKVLNFLAIAVLLAVAGVVAFFLWFKESVEDTELTITSTEEIGLTPEQVQSIKTIGEWEFLAVSSEELIDTTRKGVFSDDHLVRIYYGTVRLGVNMHQLEPGWISASGDSLLVTLPPIGILDNNFIAVIFGSRRILSEISVVYPKVLRGRELIIKKSIGTFSVFL